LPYDLPDDRRTGSVGETKLGHSIAGHDEQTSGRLAQFRRPDQTWPEIEMPGLLRFAGEAPFGILVEDG
jgi:hypothetical protein